MQKRLTVLQYIRKCSIKKIWYSLLLLVAVLVMLWFLPIRHQIFPLHLELPGTNTFQSIYESGEQYVEISPEKLYYTGYDYYSDEKLAGHYYYSIDESQHYVAFYVLPVNMGKSAESTIEHVTLRGKLLPLGNAYQSLTDALAGQLSWTFDGVAAVTDTVMFSTVDYWTFQQIILYLLLAAAFLISLFVTTRHVLFIIYPALSPAYCSLYKYGSPAKIIQEVDREIQEECLVLTKDMALLSDYLVEFSEDISVIVPLKHILWVYEHATLHQSSSFKRLSYTLHIVMEDGDSYVFNHKIKDDIDIIISELSLRYPNFFYGYSDEHYDMVKHILREAKEEQKQRHPKKAKNKKK